MVGFPGSISGNPDEDLDILWLVHIAAFRGLPLKPVGGLEPDLGDHLVTMGVCKPMGLMQHRVDPPSPLVPKGSILDTFRS